MLARELSPLYAQWQEIMKTQTIHSVTNQPDVSRRQFLKHASVATAGAAVAAQFPLALTGHAAPDDPIRIGVIGCGGRGTGAALDALGARTRVIYPQAGYHTEDVERNARAAQKNVQIVALADVFPDRLANCREQLKRLEMQIPDDACFTGFDAYKKLLAVPEVNYVILATPPHFRPIHLKAAIEAGKNAFMEKPGAVDGPGVRMVMEAGDLAKQKNLGIVAGTQRRHLASYSETIKRIQDGAIGDLLYGRCYWNGGVIWVIDRKPEWTDMEWQLRNWNYFTWLGGDHIVEQHVHNLDIMHWVFNAHPTKAYGMGGRQARPNRTYGHIYDHFAVEFEFENGAHVFSQCRQMEGCADRVGEWVVGNKGQSDCQRTITVQGGDTWRFPGRDSNAYQQEHADLIRSIREGQPLNEAHAVAESTLMGIMGREAAYSGQVVEWDATLNTSRHLGPETYEFGPLPFPEVAVPGKYRLA